MAGLWPPTGIVSSSVNRVPARTVSVARRGSVPYRVPWRPRVTREAPFRLNADVNYSMIATAEVAAPFGFDSGVEFEVTGGSVGVTREAPFRFGADLEFGQSYPVEAPFGFGGEVEWEIAPAYFPSSGMDKSSNQTISINTWVPITSWAIRSGYPETVIVTNGIEVPNGVEVSISGQLTYNYQDSFSGNGMRMRVMAGANQIGSVGSTAGNGTVAALTPFTWKNETGSPQLVTVQGYSTSSSFGRNVIVGGVNSYLVLEYVAPLKLRASDDFNRANGPLGPNWITTGGGTLNIVDGHLNGVGTPSVPLSYAWWHEPMQSETQVVRAVMRWDGYDPEHSACGLVVRANPSGTPTAPGREFGVQFSWTRGIMALYYEDFNAPNGFTPVTGVPSYVSTSKFPEGALVELTAAGNLYTASVNGVVMLQGTVADSIIPFSNDVVGLTIQDDSQVSGGGEPPGRLDDFQAFTP